MQSRKHIFQPWSTSSFGHTPNLSAVEQMALGDHLGMCRSPHGHLFALHCAAQTMRGFMVSRFVTTLVIAALLISMTALVL